MVNCAWAKRSGQRAKYRGPVSPPVAETCETKSPNSHNRQTFLVRQDDCFGHSLHSGEDSEVLCSIRSHCFARSCLKLCFTHSPAQRHGCIKRDSASHGCVTCYYQWQSNCQRHSWRTQGAGDGYEGSLRQGENLVHFPQLISCHPLLGPCRSPALLLSLWGIAETVLHTSA